MTTNSDTSSFLTTSVDDAAADLLFRKARTVQTFSADPVDDTTLAAAWDLAKWGPTAFNSLPLRLLVVRSAESRTRLATHMFENNRERVLNAPVTLVVAIDHDFHRQLAHLAPQRPTLTDDLEADPDTRTRVSVRNAWLQTGYLVTALRAVGLAVAPMVGMDAAGVDADLLAGTSWRTQLVLNVGYAVGDGGARPRAARLNWDEIATLV